jgi:hypothetical protein
MWETRIDSLLSVSIDVVEMRFLSFGSIWPQRPPIRPPSTTCFLVKIGSLTLSEFSLKIWVEFVRVDFIFAN